MSLLSIYISGACISGFIFMLLAYIGPFYKFMCNSIDEAKNEMKNSDEYSLQEQALLDALDHNTIINFLNLIISALSWLGMLLIIIYVLSWAINSITKKFTN